MGETVLLKNGAPVFYVENPLETDLKKIKKIFGVVGRVRHDNGKIKKVEIKFDDGTFLFTNEFERVLPGNAVILKEINESKCFQCHSNQQKPDFFSKFIENSLETRPLLSFLKNEFLTICCSLCNKFVHLNCLHGYLAKFGNNFHGECFYGDIFWSVICVNCVESRSQSNGIYSARRTLSNWAEFCELILNVVVVGKLLKFLKGESIATMESVVFVETENIFEFLKNNFLKLSLPRQFKQIIKSEIQENNFQKIKNLIQNALTTNKHKFVSNGDKWTLAGLLGNCSEALFAHLSGAREKKIEIKTEIIKAAPLKRKLSEEAAPPSGGVGAQDEKKKEKSARRCQGDLYLNALYNKNIAKIDAISSLLRSNVNPFLSNHDDNCEILSKLIDLHGNEKYLIRKKENVVSSCYGFDFILNLFEGCHGKNNNKEIVKNNQKIIFIDLTDD